MLAPIPTLTPTLTLSLTREAAALCSLVITPPTQVLCAFELLLREAGGVLSDVYGEPIDLLAEARSLVITPMHVHVHA